MAKKLPVINIFMMQPPPPNGDDRESTLEKAVKEKKRRGNFINLKTCGVGDTDVTTFGTRRWRSK